MGSTDSDSTIRLYHDGELNEIRSLLHELEATVQDCVGQDAVLDPAAVNPAVVIATPTRVMHYQPVLNSTRPTLIVVLDGDSRMLRAHLRRIEVDMLVRRPVHPSALRLLLLHVLYRGPERRSRKRVTIGAPIKIKSGLFSKSAILTEISLRGCRLLSRSSLKPKRQIQLQIPATVTGGRALKLQGTVVRTAASPDHDAGVTVVGVRFADSRGKEADRIKAIVDAHSKGPARMTDPARDYAAAQRPGLDAQRSEPDTAGPEAAATKGANLPVESEAATDRRSADRHAYERRIVALGEQATRVLIGRDISTGGMRVDIGSGLGLGDRLRLALHAGANGEPLVLEAVVRRDDGDDGLMLTFEATEDTLVDRQLGRLLSNLPLLDTRADASDDDAPRGMVISEIIEHQTG